ncbi:MAG: RsmB/NOP family class I SAM-dependent RNA methyltransferase [Hydrogenophilus sp.]|nr:RsmB/NOP family class I SAM-dependent RNA methyltransferase [Hydrogenophilus sp.]
MEAFEGATVLRATALEAALQEWQRGGEAADRVLTATLRGFSRLGQRDRGWVREGYYQILRHWRRLSVWAESSEPRALVLAWWVGMQGGSVRALERWLRPGEEEWLAAQKLAGAKRSLSEAERWSLPDWLWRRWREAYGEKEAQAIAEAMLREAPFDLRVNTLKMERSGVLARFTAEGMAARPTRWSPVGVRLGMRMPLFHHPLYVSGAVEVQDEGSQLSALLVAPRRREWVVDFCAGAGGKTLLLAAAMANSGQIFAADRSAKRLAALRPRLARAGVSNVQPVVVGNSKGVLSRLEGKVDRVLVDVPCSGTGTLRRNPDFKWRWREEDLALLVREQEEILSAAAVLVRPGGRLVYVTCSVLPEENDGVVARFLARRGDFRWVPHEVVTGEWREEESGAPFVNGPVPVGGRSEALRLFPHVHGTDGFFAAILERQ